MSVLVRVCGCVSSGCVSECVGCEYVGVLVDVCVWEVDATTGD